MVYRVAPDAHEKQPLRCIISLGRAQQVPPCMCRGYPSFQQLCWKLGWPLVLPCKNT